jgi:hypothetical protein
VCVGCASVRCGRTILYRFCRGIYLCLSFLVSFLSLLCFLSLSLSLSLALSSISRMRKESVSSSENKSKREWETFSVVFLGFHSLASRFNLSLSSPSHSLLLVRAWFALAECVCVSLWLNLLRGLCACRFFGAILWWEGRDRRLGS